MHNAVAEATNSTLPLIGVSQTVAAGYLLLILTAVCAIVAVIQRRSIGAVVATVWKDYRSVLWCFLALSGLAALLGFYADGAAGAGGDFWATAAANVFASLVENLIFFSLLGFGLLIVQRREADRNRGLDDRLDLLFNAKQLRSGESSFLRDELRRISADCQSMEVAIDVVDHDTTEGLVEIDVMRNWLIANYLSDESAVYDWRLRIASDAIPSRLVAMTVYPSYSATLTRASDGEWRNATDDELLHPGGDLGSSERLDSDPRPLTIEPSAAREFRTRFRGWQLLYDGPPVPSADRMGPVRPDPGSYKFNVSKHWDEVRVMVTNSLKRDLRVSIYQSIGSGPQKLLRKMDLASGDRQRQPVRLENLPAGSRVYVSFEPL